MAKTTKKPSAKKTAKKTPARASSPSDEQRKALIGEFKTMVNMTPGQIEKFLHTKESTRVGFRKQGRGESVGHASGRRIIQIKAKMAAELTADDLKHMKKVLGYIARHCKQGPHHREDVRESKWRASLMNWGHDPLNGGGCGPGT